MGRRFDFATPTPLHLLLPAGKLAALKLHEPMFAWVLNCDNSTMECDPIIDDGSETSLIIDSIHKGVWSGSYRVVTKNGDKQESRFMAVAKKQKLWRGQLVCL